MWDAEESGAFGELLRQHRLASSLTQEELAARSGLGTRSIQNLERGANRPHRETLRLLANSLALTGEPRTQFEAAAQPLPRGPRGDPSQVAARGVPIVSRGFTSAHPVAVPVASSGSTTATVPVPRHNLPVQVTSFVGLRSVLAESKERLQGTHVLTLTGAGGCGKTRLALEIAADVLDSYPDGVWFVDLAPLSDPLFILPTVMTTLRVADVPGRSPLLVLGDYLRRRATLLILDNCEHVIDACAHVVESLVQAGPALRILATSRELLGVSGEVALRVPSLSLPDPQSSVSVAELKRSEAVQLFIERARLVQPGFGLTDENGAALARICRRLDGIPFAIELAAARMRVLAVEQIAARLDDRFGLLTGGRRTALRRQQTLRALVDWSYDLLTDNERRLLRRLAVFAGGWTLEAAEAVGADVVVGGAVTPGSSTSAHHPEPIAPRDVLDLLSGLVDKSLVIAEQGVFGERYRFLETLRQYAEEKLVEAEDVVVVRDRHREWFLALSDRLAADPNGPYPADALDQFVAERDNLRAALDWCQTHRLGAPRGLRLAVSYANLAWGLWYLGEGTGEALTWVQTFLDLVPEPTATRGDALLYGSLFARYGGDSERSIAFAEEALTVMRGLGNEEGVNVAEAQIAVALGEEGKYVQALEHLETTVAWARSENRKFLLAARLRDVGLVLTSVGNVQGARAALEESLVIARDLGSLIATSRVLLHLGNLNRIDGNLARAQAQFDESIGMLSQSTQAYRGTSLNDIDFQISQALLAAAKGDADGARVALRARLRSQWRRGDSRWSGTLLCVLGSLAVMGQKMQSGVELIAAGAAANPWYSTIQFPAVRLDVASSLAQAKAALGEEAFAAAWGEGQAMSLEQVILSTLDDGPHDS